jgi:hypothetical protein
MLEGVMTMATTKKPSGRAAPAPESAGTVAPDAHAATADGTAVAAPEEPPRVPMPVPAGGWPPDEFSGMAGRFVRDPYTGVRRRAK